MSEANPVHALLTICHHFFRERVLSFRTDEIRASKAEDFQIKSLLRVVEDWTRPDRAFPKTAKQSQEFSMTQRTWSGLFAEPLRKIAESSLSAAPPKERYE